MNNIYSTSDIDMLCKSVGSTKHLVESAFRRVIEDTIDAQDGKLSMIETQIHSLPLDRAEYASYEPFGEAKYFVIFDEYNTLRLEFWVRHLKRFLFEARLRDMPLLINVPFLSILASWRLKIGK